VGAVVVVVFAEGLDEFAGVVKVQELVFVETLVAELAVEALDVAVLCRLARRDEAVINLTIVRPTLQSEAANSGPLSVMRLRGRPRRSATQSSTRATRGPDNEVSASIHRHSRV
jgi:hypothetical protein